MTDRRSFIKGAGAIGGVALTSGCIGQFGSQPYGDGTLTFVMSPTEPQEQMTAQYTPVKEYLGKQVADDVSVKLQYAKNYSAVLRALGEGNAELAETGPFAAALGVKGEQCEIALQRHAYGSWTYHSVIVTREETDISKPSDLKGKKIAFADTTSASGSLYPLYMLQQAGLEIGDAPLSDEGADFSATWSGHAQAFKSLMDGQVDAAGVGRFITWNYEKGDYKEGVAQVAKESGIPRAPIVASPKLDDKKQEKLVSAFEEAPDSMYFGADGEKGTDDDLWFDGVRKADLETYQPVIDVANKLGIESDLLDKA
ncbi:MAG: substrate-binding domain-containing protein [Halopenitus sp.]